MVGSRETVAIIHAGGEAGVDHSDGHGSGGEEKDPEYICKVDLREFVDILGGKIKQVKDDSRFFGPSNWKFCKAAAER